jgi:hypothetical protein
MAMGMFLERESKTKGDGEVSEVPTTGPYGLDDAAMLALFKEAKKRAFDHRWQWERVWMRNIHYVNNRQWITYIRKANEWIDVKLAKWIPKPVINKLGEGVTALRAMFASVNIGVNVRPVGDSPENIAVAACADQYGPILHEEHSMDDVMNENDFWFIVTGNVFLHTYYERDAKHGVTEIPFEMCLQCNTIYSTPEIAEKKNLCDCGGTQFGPAVSPETNMPIEPEVQPNGKGITISLSPFELAFDSSYPRFDDVPEVIRLRWRSKDYYEGHPKLKEQVKHIKWSKAPSETSLQLFRSLPYQSDLGVAPFLGNNAGGQGEELGAAEYEMWVRPCNKYPQGLVIRVLGDSNPIILHLEDEEAIPGPIPYQDADGAPVFMFSHAAFEQRGGRVYGTSPLDGVISQQNLLNQLWSFFLMIVNRVGNPLWLVPKGAEVERFTGEPGLVVKWNPLTVGGNAKPERLDGQNIPASLFTLEEKVLKNIEEGLGTYDIVKGQKPSGVEAFAAMNLLVERAQSRFASAFKSRGNLYKDWFKFALEIEREFGPDKRMVAVMSPAKSWTRKQFERANIQGCFSVVVEDGSNTPKTVLGERAAIEHLNSLGFIDPQDPDQRYKIYQKFGQTSLSPALDIHMQSALRKQQAFEEWANDPTQQQVSAQKAEEELMQWQQTVASTPPPPPAVVQPAAGANGKPANMGDGEQPVNAAPVVDPVADEQQMMAAMPPPPNVNTHTPLKWKKWYDARIHKQEFLKWMNGDTMVELLNTNPALEELCAAHLADMDMALMEEAQRQAMSQAPPQGATPPQGAGMAMKNSNQEAGGVQTQQSQ